MGNPASQEATSAGIASDTESLPLNTGLGHAAIAWDSDTIDEWGFLRTAINQQLTPPGKLSERRVFYGYVLEHVKSSRQTTPDTAGYSLPTSVADAQARIAAAGSTRASRAAKLEAMKKAGGGGEGADKDSDRAKIRAQTALENTATARSGYVRVRIPELQPLPPVPITPGNVEAQKLCNRSSKALKRAANSLVSLLLKCPTACRNMEVSKALWWRLCYIAAASQYWHLAPIKPKSKDPMLTKNLKSVQSY